MTDAEAMARAIALARRAREWAPPNPWVGAVIVAGGEVVGEGSTHASGGPHAEVVALAAAGERARGATMYVTLEPCVHQGRTPPCTKAVIAAGIARVVVAAVDPDSRVHGKGLAELAAAGLEVEVGLEAAAVLEELRSYAKHRLTGLPWVVAKAAITLDGKVADGEGRSKWITSELARRRTHELRRLVQAIVVGRGTMEADLPELSARVGDEVIGRQPERFVLARHQPSRLSEGVVVSDAEPEAFLRQRAAAGALSVLVEGGPTLIGAFLGERLVDELILVVAPRLFGDPRAPSWARAEPPFGLDDAPSFHLADLERLGDELLVAYRSLESCNFVAGLVDDLGHFG